MDPVPDPLLLKKSGSAGNRTRDLCICSQKLWPLDHRGGPTTYVFAITSNDQISYYSPHWFISHFTVPICHADSSSEWHGFLQHLNRIPLPAHKWAVDIGSSSTQNSKLIFACECTDGRNCTSDAHLLSLFEFGGRSRGNLRRLLLHCYWTIYTYSFCHFWSRFQVTIAVLSF